MKDHWSIPGYEARQAKRHERARTFKAAVACKGRDLVEALEESVRAEIHKQLTVVTEWDNPIGYRLTGRAL